MPDTNFVFTVDGEEGTASDAFVARGATLSLPPEVSVTLDCADMRNSSGKRVTLFDVAGLSSRVAWTVNALNAEGKRLRICAGADGKLVVDIQSCGLAIMFR